MNDKRTDFVNILCWLALIIAGLIFLMFIIASIYKFATKDRPSKPVQKNTETLVEVDEEDTDGEEETEENDKKNNSSGKNDTSKIATVETHYNYMQGFKDGTFGPMQGITRSEVATIFARLDKKFDENKVYYNNQYTDVKAESWYSNYIGYCSRELIMQGYNNGTFGPNVKMKKIEFLAAVVRYAEVDYFGYKSKYSDVKGTWAEEYIGYLEAMGYISGKNATTLGAQDNITRAEVCSVINSVVDRRPNKSMIDATNKKAYFKDVPKTAWYYYDVVEATTYHDIDLYHVQTKKK